MKARSFSISLSSSPFLCPSFSPFLFEYLFEYVIKKKKKKKDKEIKEHENLYNFQDSSILKYERMIPLFGPPFFHTPCSLYSFHSLQHENLSTILKFDGRTHDSFISFPFFSSHNLRHKNLSNFSKIRVF